MDVHYRRRIAVGQQNYNGEGLPDYETWELTNTEVIRNHIRQDFSNELPPGVHLNVNFVMLKIGGRPVLVPGGYEEDPDGPSYLSCDTPWYYCPGCGQRIYMIRDKDIKVTWHYEMVSTPLPATVMTKRVARFTEEELP